MSTWITYIKSFPDIYSLHVSLMLILVKKIKTYKQCVVRWLCGRASGPGFETVCSAVVVWSSVRAGVRNSVARWLCGRASGPGFETVCSAVVVWSNVRAGVRNSV